MGHLCPRALETKGAGMKAQFNPQPGLSHTEVGTAGGGGGALKLPVFSGPPAEARGSLSFQLLMTL